MRTGADTTHAARSRRRVRQLRPRRDGARREGSLTGKPRRHGCRAAGYPPRAQQTRARTAPACDAALPTRRRRVRGGSGAPHAAGAAGLNAPGPHKGSCTKVAAATPSQKQAARHRAPAHKANGARAARRRGRASAARSCARGATTGSGPRAPLAQGGLRHSPWGRSAAWRTQRTHLRSGGARRPPPAARALRHGAGRSGEKCAARLFGRYNIALTGKAVQFARAGDSAGRHRCGAAPTRSAGGPRSASGHREQAAASRVRATGECVSACSLPSCL